MNIEEIKNTLNYLLDNNLRLVENGFEKIAINITGPAGIGKTAIIKQLADEGMTMLIVTHELNFAKNVSNKIIFMEDGKIIESNTTKEFFENPKEERTKEFLKTITQTH